MNIEKAETLEDYIKNHPPKGFNPTPFLLSDARQITWFWSNDRCYAETARDKDGNQVGTLYWAEDEYKDFRELNRRLVGCTIFIQGDLLDEMKEYITKQLYLSEKDRVLTQ